MKLTAHNIILAPVAALLLSLTACGDDKAADQGKAATPASSSAPAASAPASSASGSHPVLDGVERADGVVYYEDFYPE